TNNDPADALYPLDMPGSVAIYDTAIQKEVGRYEFRLADNSATNYPYALTVMSDGSKAYVASQRDAAVYVLNTKDATKPTLAATLPTGSHPDALLLNKSQSRLFVANAQSDTVSIVDTATDKIISTILLRPEVAKDVPAATPT